MRSAIVLAVMLFPVLALGDTPAAPPTLCVDDDCRNHASAPRSGSKKWHPGHYIKTQGSFHSTDQSAYVDGVMRTLPRVMELPQLRGAYVDFAWGAINPSGTTYDWENLDQVVDWLCSRNKMLLLSIGYKHFAGDEDAQLIMPADLIANGQAVSTNSGKIAAVWRAPVMNRYISTMKAIAARYDASPCLELITTSESAPSFGDSDPPSDYSVAALAEQLERLYVAQSEAFKQTNVAAQVNFLGNRAAGLIESAYRTGAGRAGPDAFDDTGTRIFRGQQVAGAGTTARDYRGLVLQHAVASQPVLGGKDDNGPPANIVNWAQANGVTHLSWVSTVSTSPNTWSEIREAIRADGTLHTNCPAAYTSCSTQ
jgi:hypothetical protein